MNDLVLYFSLKYKGDFQKIYSAIKNYEKIDIQEQEKLLKEFNETSSKYVTIFDDDYPETLKKINCPPFVLYYYGDLSLVKGKTIGVVGTKDMSDYGKETTEYFVKELVKKDYTVVSGMAKGISTVAHQTAIKQEGKTIAILGTGIDYCYPWENNKLYDCLKENHLIISEYPFKTAPQKQNFPFRNRIIAGISDGILITESKEKSGSMITAGYALEQGKDIYCVPNRYNDDNQGNNQLIQNGADLVICIQDLIRKL